MQSEKPSLVPVYIGTLSLIVFLGLWTGLLLYQAPREPQNLLPGKISAENAESPSGEQEALKGAPPALPDLPEALGRGLLLRLAVETSEKRYEDTRIVSGPEIAVAEGEAASALLPRLPFDANFVGWLEIPKRTRCRFLFEGTGDCTLVIDGKTHLAAGANPESRRSSRIRLERGRHRFVLRYRAPLSGPAACRLYWEGRDFEKEPIPGALLLCDHNEKSYRASRRLHLGFAEIARSSCLDCHQPSEKGRLQQRADFARRGPSLSGLGTRLTSRYLMELVLDPKSLRPDARMPQLLRGTEPEQRQAAKDIAAFLTKDRAASSAASSEADEELLDAGKASFARLGCIACHSLPGSPEEDPSLVPLVRVGQKYRAGALVSYLLAPAAHAPYSGMPDFGLKPSEATAIAAWLRKEALPPLADPEGGDAARGERLFQESACLNCHDGEGQSAYSLTPGAFESLAKASSRGCLATDDSERGGAPIYQLAEETRVAIRVALEEIGSLFDPESPIDFARRQLVESRCAACHEMDGKADLWSRRESLTKGFAEDLSGKKPSGKKNGEKQIDQSRPTLDGVGEKLRESWIHALLSGTAPRSARPWLHARMPAMKGRAELLARGLARSSGYLDDGEDASSPRTEKITVGKALLQEKTGFGCITCHGEGNRKPTAVFEVQGIDFDLVTLRLRRAHYLRWMLDPIRLNPSTRMPKYADDRGKTFLTDFEHGNARAQFEAIWEYFRSVQLQKG